MTSMKAKQLYFVEWK